MPNRLQLETPNMRGWHWLTFFSLMLCAALFAFTSSGTSQAWAFQQAEDGAQPAEPAPGAGATDTSASDEPMEEKSFLTWMIEASGIFGLVLLLLSFVMVALIAMNAMQVRRDILLPPAFIEAFEQKLAAKDFQGAYETARSDDSFLARVLANGLSKLNRGYDEAIEGMQEVGEDENMQMEHRLSYLALIGSVAPMIGLMGTVYGMIASFRTIATSPTQPKPSELAEGISMALFTTLEGLSVAIPAMIFYGILRNRVQRYVLEVGIVSEGLMSRFSSVGKQSRSAGGAAPAAAPAAPKE
jgi:biopolymer transport protein ExbB